MSDLPDEVMNKARWEADNACIDANLERDRDGRGYLTPAEIVTLTIEVAAPILVEAEREWIKARIEVARRLLIALTQDAERGSGLIPSEVLEPRLQEIFAALSVIDEGDQS